MFFHHRTMFLVFMMSLFIFSCLATSQEIVSPSARLEFQIQNIRTNIQPYLLETLSQPDGTRLSKNLRQTTDVIDSLRNLPSYPDLSWAESADRFRYIAFLEVMLARVEREVLWNGVGYPGVDANKTRLNYAQQALKDIAEATNEINLATNVGAGAPLDLADWVQHSDLVGHLLNLAAHAHAIIWDVTKNDTERKAAEQLWQETSQTPYGKDYSRPSPELANALGITQPHPMYTILWVGLGLLCVVLIVALFIPHPSPFQMWIFRLTAALGAGGIGANLPGFLGIQSTYITAGGAAAFFIVAYLLNPPKLVRNLAGNP